MQQPKKDCLHLPEGMETVSHYELGAVSNNMLSCAPVRIGDMLGKLHACFRTLAFGDPGFCLLGFWLLAFSSQLWASSFRLSASSSQFLAFSSQFLDYNSQLLAFNSQLLDFSSQLLPFNSQLLAFSSQLLALGSWL